MVEVQNEMGVGAEDGIVGAVRIAGGNIAVLEDVVDMLVAELVGGNSLHFV